MLKRYRKSWTLKDAQKHYNMRKVPSCKTCKFSTVKSRFIGATMYDF